MRKLILSLIYLIGVAINLALLLVGVRILEAGTFSGRAGHIATGSEAVFFGISFIVIGLGGAIVLLFAGTRHLLGKRRPDDANGQSP
ncbi:MAG: hypothetical protein PVG41_03560 [Desulfobacteraceae bacterium]|jgi:hypothetical protein